VAAALAAGDTKLSSFHKAFSRNLPLVFSLVFIHSFSGEKPSVSTPSMLSTSSRLPASFMFSL
jgi:hypothetical protein